VSENDFYEFHEIPAKWPYARAWELRAKIGQNRNFNNIGRIALFIGGGWGSEIPGLERKDDHASKSAALKHIIDRRYEDMAQIMLTYQLRMAELHAKIEEEEEQ
jgi:hypothetical protein